MPDVNLGLNSDGQTSKPEKDEGLMDVPVKSPLEQTAAANHQTPPNPVASSAMPEASPESVVSNPNPTLAPVTTGGQEEEETASVPDTDKFLESILEDNNKGPAVQSPADQPLPIQPTPSVPAAPSVPVVENNTAGNIDISTPPSFTPSAEPLNKFTEEAKIPEIHDNQEADSNQSKIRDDIKGIDAVVNGISAPNEPSKSVSENPVGMMQASRSSGKSKTGLLILLFAILGIGGYFAYNYMFSGATTTTTDNSLNTAQETSTVYAAAQTDDQTRKDDLATIQNALENFYAATGNYPISDGREALNSTNNVLEKELVSAGYLNALPYDPDYQKYYAYKSDDGSTFSLTAVLDDATDPDATVQGGLAIYEITQNTPMSVSTGTAVSDAADEAETVYTDLSADYSTSVSELPVQ